MIRNLKGAIVLALVLSINIVSAQRSDNISEAQLIEIITNARQRGMSQKDIKMYAESKGYSEAAINSVMQRDNPMKSGIVGGQASMTGQEQRQMVQFGNKNLNKSESDSIMGMSEEELKIFGYEVFHNNGMNFTPNLNMATPKDYVVGPGDELLIQIYGIAQATINLKISAEGKVVIPNVGVSHVGGLSIEAVKTMLTQKIGTRYAGLAGTNPSSFLMVTLANIRSIKINIVGDVKKPGTYQLPSFTTSFNALYAAGGPTVKGSFRNIQIFRAGQQIAQVDLYDFLLKGKTEKNIRLEDNDVLLVPKYVKRVEIVGEIRRELIFEIKDKETITSLIEMANGFTESAYKNMVSIQRYNGIDKSILNITANDQLTTTLEDGDYVIVGKTPNIYKNRVQLVGSVLREGDYELLDNFKIADLIEKAGGLKQEAFLGRAILYRTGKELQQKSINIDLNKVLANDPDNNLILNREDLLVISSIYDTRENHFVTIQGEVNQVGNFPFSQGMTVGELVLKAKGFKEAAAGSIIEIVRRELNNKSSIAKIIKVAIDNELTINTNENNTVLEPFDQVFVRASAGYKDFQKVYVQGEANYVGQFIMNNSVMTVGDLIKRAGGVLPSANVKGALLVRRTIFYKKEASENDYLNKLLELRERFRDSTESGFTQSNENKLNQLNNEIDKIYLNKSKIKEQIDDNLDSEAFSNKQLIYRDSSKKNEETRFNKQNIEDLKTTLQARVFKNLKDVTVNEDQYQFVAINLAKIINSSSTNEFDMQLQDGDILYIPTYNETVMINGDVLYPVTVKYIKENSLKNYINQAGGFNKTALRKRSYVVDANGAVRRTHSFYGIKFYPTVSPGSQIFVPKNNKAPSIFSFDRVLSLVSSLVTTYLLVKNLSK